MDLKFRNIFETFQPSMHKSIKFDIKSEIWGHSEKNKGSWIRLYASVPEDTKTMHEISSKTVY